MVNWLLIAANVLCFLIELAAGPRAEAFVTALGVVPRRFLLDPGPEQVMTLLSSMFLHGGWLHLGGNML
ncbi:MAG: rhomboid family intramembrane serine protease, partial [Chloroflexota bacterium]|nr:rhomboid family intramembrane serine protease [Chloroflexota bacterium]